MTDPLTHLAPIASTMESHAVPSLSTARPMPRYARRRSYLHTLVLTLQAPRYGLVPDRWFYSVGYCLAPPPVGRCFVDNHHSGRSTTNGQPQNGKKPHNPENSPSDQHKHNPNNPTTHVTRPNTPGSGSSGSSGQAPDRLRAVARDRSARLGEARRGSGSIDRRPEPGDELGAGDVIRPRSAAHTRARAEKDPHARAEKDPHARELEAGDVPGPPHQQQRLAVFGFV